MTTQAAKETMMVIEEKLGVTSSILARTIFHGQHSLNNLLEATDAKLKEELALIVPLQLWQEAATVARARGREATKRSNELQGMLSLRTNDLDKLRRQRDAALDDFKAKQEALNLREAELKETRRSHSRNESRLKADSHSIDVLEKGLTEIDLMVEELQQKLESLNTERDSTLHPIQMRLAEVSESSAEASRSHQQLRVECRTKQFCLEAAKKQVHNLEAIWQVDLSAGTVPLEFEVPEECPTCHQSTASQGSREHIQSSAEQDMNEALQNLITAQTEYDQTLQNIQHSERILKDYEQQLSNLKAELRDSSLELERRVSSVEEELRKCRQKQRDRSEALRVAATQLQQTTAAESLVSARLHNDREAARYAKEKLEGVSNEVEDMESTTKDLVAQREREQNIAKQMSSLSDAFGTRGIQTFVLQNAVKDLQVLSQKYLDDLSEGNMRLVLELDSGDRISRTASVRDPDGTFRERPLATLSGGQWRRCSIALTLGFADLVARRGRLRPSLLVLDEPLTHLDRAGRASVGRLLRKLLGDGHTNEINDSHGISQFTVSTIIVILQDLAAEELEEAFDRIDEVVKEDGASLVKVDEVS